MSISPKPDDAGDSKCKKCMIYFCCCYRRPSIAEEIKEELTIKYEDDKERFQYILKVLLLFDAQLIITMVVTWTVYFTDLYIWVVDDNYSWLFYYVCPALTGTILLFILCFGRWRYKLPLNVIFLIYSNLIITCASVALSCLLAEDDQERYIIIVIGGGNFVILVSFVIFNFNFFVNLISVSIFAFVYLAIEVFVFHREMFDFVIPVSISLLYVILVIIEAEIIIKGYHFYNILPGEWLLGGTHLFVDTFLCPLIIINILKMFADCIIAFTKK